MAPKSGKMKHSNLLQLDDETGKQFYTISLDKQRATTKIRIRANTKEKQTKSTSQNIVAERNIESTPREPIKIESVTIMEKPIINTISYTVLRRGEDLPKAHAQTTEVNVPLHLVKVVNKCRTSPFGGKPSFVILEDATAKRKLMDHIVDDIRITSETVVKPKQKENAIPEENELKEALIKVSKQNNPEMYGEVPKDMANTEDCVLKESKNEPVSNKVDYGITVGSQTEKFWLESALCEEFFGNQFDMASTSTGTIGKLNLKRKQFLPAHSNTNVRKRLSSARHICRLKHFLNLHGSKHIVPNGFIASKQLSRLSLGPSEKGSEKFAISKQSSALKANKIMSRWLKPISIKPQSNGGLGFSIKVNAQNILMVENSTQTIEVRDVTVTDMKSISQHTESSSEASQQEPNTEKRISVGKTEASTSPQVFTIQQLQTPNIKNNRSDKFVLIQSKAPIKNALASERTFPDISSVPSKFYVPYDPNITSISKQFVAQQRDEQQILPLAKYQIPLPLPPTSQVAQQNMPSVPHSWSMCNRLNSRIKVTHPIQRVKNHTMGQHPKSYSRPTWKYQMVANRRSVLPIHSTLGTQVFVPASEVNIAPREFANKPTGAINYNEHSNEPSVHVVRHHCSYCRNSQLTSGSHCLCAPLPANFPVSHESPYRLHMYTEHPQVYAPPIPTSTYSEVSAKHEANRMSCGSLFYQPTSYIHMPNTDYYSMQALSLTKSTTGQEAITTHLPNTGTCYLLQTHRQPTPNKEPVQVSDNVETVPSRPRSPPPIPPKIYKSEFMPLPSQYSA